MPLSLEFRLPRYRFINPEHVRDVLEELKRLMPKADARAVLANDPSWLLRVERGTKYLGAFLLCLGWQPAL